MKTDTKWQARQLPYLLGTLLLLLAFAAPVLRPAPAAAARADGEASLDLAALVLTPDDLEAEGLEGYGVADAGTLSPDEVAAAFAFQRRISEEEARGLFAGAGLVRAYELRLDIAPDAGVVPPASVTSTVYEFADEDGAADGLAILTSWSGSDTVEEVEGDQVIGDGSVLIRRRGTTPDPYLALDLTFQVGRLTAVVRLADFTGDEPAIADAERLAERLSERIEGGADDAEYGVGAQSLRLAGDGVTSGWDYYTVYDGEFRRSARESAEDAAATAEEIADAGMVAEYVVLRRIGISGLPEEDAYLYVYVEHFAGADAASDYLQGELDRAAEDDRFENLAELEDLAEYGDEFVAYTQTLTWHGVDLTYQTYSLRVGDRVASILLIAPTAPPISALEDLAAAQAACLDRADCLDPAPLPADLQAMVDAARRADDPDRSRRNAAALPPTERTWTGPTFGVELTYDPAAWVAIPWEIFADVETMAGDDGLALVEHPGRSVLTLSVVAGGDGATACVEERIAGLADDEARGAARPVLDEAGQPVGGGDAERAYAAYGVHLEDGQRTFLYLECRSLADGEAMLLIDHVGPLDDYEERTEAREALLDGLVLPDH